MSLSAPVRRLPIRCLYMPPIRTPLLQRRAASSDSDNPQPNPILEKFRRENPDDLIPTGPPDPSDMPEGLGQAGDISRSSIFEDERREHQLQKPVPGSSSSSSAHDITRVGGLVRDPKHMARVLDPDPRGRQAWERRQVIKMVKKGGRLSREAFLKRTEREHVVRSPNFKTSVKKLGMLARQIAGKTVDEALVQMRFSKKKVAGEVLRQLEAARDEAVVMRGMGLGLVGESAAAAAQEGETETANAKAKAVEIQLKDGKRHRVTDTSNIYIDQAWVGRGPYGKLPDYRARGRLYIMRTPWTSLSVVLKEEATRVREWEEREAKRQKRLKEKVWTAMPDRPIQIQKQWYSW